MVIRSHFPDIEIPELDVLTFLYGDTKDGNYNVSDKPLWVDAVDDGKSLSPAEGLRWIKRLALGLDRRGLKKGDVVLVVSPNHVFVPIAYLGIVGSGRIYSGVNPTYTVDEICHQIKDTGASLILVHPALLSKTEQAATKANLSPTSSLLLFADTVESPIDGMQDWRTILGPERQASSYRWPRLSGSDSKSTVAALNYSSGTTGLPKGVMISHYNLIANVCQARRSGYNDYEGRLVAPTDERWIGLLPMFHAYGQIFFILLGLKLGVTIYVLPMFDFDLFLKTIQDRKITTMQVAPPIMVLLNKHPAVAKYDLSSLLSIGCGAAPLSRGVQSAVQEKCEVSVGQGWGMTEVTCMGTGIPDDMVDDTGSVGTVVPNSQIRLVDERGQEITTVGDRGEILYRGPNVCMGYWRNEAASKETVTDDGWLRTGDIAVADERRWLRIVDRKKELIKVSGLQVAPAELEALLLTHDAVADAAVIGIASSFSDQELVRAYVVLHPAARGRVQENDIVKWVSERVAKHKHLSGGVVFVDLIPKSPAGKILRKVLREEAHRGSRRGSAKL